MSDQEIKEAPPPAKWPSIDEAKPKEEGGPVARTGFNYQDEIAVSFLLEMLEASEIAKVHCETHDDIVLVRIRDGKPLPIAEFVQVKASTQDKLWSVADICKQEKKSAGTSILERSLGRDEHDERSMFRIVTLRPVNGDLELLTYACGTDGRKPDCDAFKALHAEIHKRLPELVSPKGNGLPFWLESCFWDQRHSEDVVRTDNLRRMLQLSIKENKGLLIEQADQLLDELRLRAKKAGDAKWQPDPHKKIITQTDLRSWWENRTKELRDGTALASGGKLAAKMTEAALPEDVINLAVELRRSYSEITRTPRYQEPAEIERLQNRVKSEIMSLRSRHVSGRLDADGAAFHALCVERMDEINAEGKAGAEDGAAYLKGCMYDIADRCLLRFVRPE